MLSLSIAMTRSSCQIVSLTAMSQSSDGRRHVRKWCKLFGGRRSSSQLTINVKRKCCKDFSRPNRGVVKNTAEAKRTRVTRRARRAKMFGLRKKLGACQAALISQDARAEMLSVRFACVSRGEKKASAWVAREAAKVSQEGQDACSPKGGT